MYTPRHLVINKHNYIVQNRIQFTIQGIKYKCSPKYSQPVEVGTPNKKARTLQNTADPVASKHMHTRTGHTHNHHKRERYSRERSRVRKKREWQERERVQEREKRGGKMWPAKTSQGVAAGGKSHQQPSTEREMM